MSEATKGPWKWNGFGGRTWLEGNGEYIIKWNEVTGYLKVSDADADLIARAPELLKENEELENERAKLIYSNVHLAADVDRLKYEIKNLKAHSKKVAREALEVRDENEALKKRIANLELKGPARDDLLSTISKLSREKDQLLDSEKILKLELDGLKKKVKELKGEVKELKDDNERLDDLLWRQ